MPRISAVINTLNEEKNLPFALRSVRPWVDEIIVVDMHSHDRTVDIARGFGAKVLLHERVEFFDAARAFAIEQASGDWILVLDADEVVPLPLSQVLLSMASAGDADVVHIHRLNYMLGTPLMHTNCGPQQDRQPRFFKKECVRVTATIHNFFHPLPGSRVLELRFQPGLAFAHFTYLDSRDFLERLNRYTDIEAKQAFERGERLTPLGALVRAAREFGGRYLKGRGFQDGWRGVYISLFYTFYRIVAAAKLQELTTLGGRNQIESIYRQQAEEILQAYCEPALRLNSTPWVAVPVGDGR